MSQIKDITKELRTILPDLVIKEQESMKAHTSFRIGGPCDLMVVPQNAEELRAVFQILRTAGVRPLVLGACSNVLVPDAGIRGVVVSTKGMQNLARIGDTGIVAACGVPMGRLANFACECGLTGLEFAQGIPGTVGGGMFMNAGAYDGELKNVAVRTKVMTFDGEIKVYSGEEQGLRYRGSNFQTMDAVILETEFCLQPGDPDQIRDKMLDFAQRRRSKQPLELPSAGSTFKRPAGYFAGALIQEAGLKGFRIGGAQVSEKHAGFVVNVGDATAEDVLNLINHVRKTVFDKTRIELEPEVRLL